MATASTLRPWFTSDFGTMTSEGVSATARSLASAVIERIAQSAKSALGQEHVRRAQAALESILAEVESVIQQGGQAPTPEAIQEALSLLTSLPERLPFPTLLLEPHGGVAAEWFKSPRNIVVASVNGTGNLQYAGIFSNGLQVHGKAPLNSGLLEVLESNVTRLTSHGI